MKHICIITYSFLPLNFVATWRQYYRAKYLLKEGYRVTIITRHWEKNAQHRSLEPTYSAETSKEYLWEGVEVIRLPAGSRHLENKLPSWKRKILKRTLKGNPQFTTLYRQLAFFLLPMDYHLRLIYSRNEVTNLVNGTPDVVIASGDPWHIFEVGNDLASALDSKLICEYRDPWNYQDDRFRVEGFNSFNANPLSQLKRRTSIQRERKLTRNADAIISVSEPWTTNASNITGISKAFTITNGFEPEEFERVQPEEYKQFTITYIGNLHAPPQQNIMPFIIGLNQFLDQDKDRLQNTRVRFIGTADSYNFTTTESYLKTCKYYDQVIEVTGKIDKQTSIKIQKSSHLLLFVAHEKLVGQYPAKIFEYLAADTPIMLAPDDHGVCHNLIDTTKTGRVCSTGQEVSDYLCALYTTWQKHGHVPCQADKTEVAKYTYEAQNQKLIQILEEAL